MKTECTWAQLEGHGRRRIEGGFDGGHISSDGGAALLRELDARLGITQGLAGCFTDHRDPELIEHAVLELVRQRVYGIALGYEDLNDHDDLKRDPLLGLTVGKAGVEGKGRRRVSDKGKVLASSSTLNRLELTRLPLPRRLPHSLTQPPTLPPAPLNPTKRHPHGRTQRKSEASRRDKNMGERGSCAHTRPN